MNNPDGGRPCTACGAEVPHGHVVCPSCTTPQPPTTKPAAPSAPAGFAAVPPGFSATPSHAPAWSASPPSPGHRAPARRSSRGPLVLTVIVVLALVGAGAWFFTQRADEPSGSASKPTADGAEQTTTIAPKPLAWTPVTDPASGLTFTMPGENVMSLPDSIATATGGPIGVNPTLWTGDGDRKNAQVTIWGPSANADQAAIDQLLAFHHDMYGRANTPYAKPLTVAGVPATVVDGSTKSSKSFEALATVDGSLVLIELVTFDGSAPDAAVFEQLVASFAKG